MSAPNAVLANVRLAPGQDPIDLPLEAGRIAGGPVAGAVRRIDGRGLVAVPGFVDLHVHGARGFDFMDGAMGLFDRLIKLRAQYGKFVRELRSYLGQLPVGSFGKETMEMALGFIVASGRGRDRAQLWLAEPNRYKQEAAGRLEDVISRTMNYQTALRMVQ